MRRRLPTSNKLNPPKGNPGLSLTSELARFSFLVLILATELPNGYLGILQVLHPDQRSV